jgi:hypothetical protein
MISILSLATILVVHWIFDFFLQTSWQATNKSKNNIALASHVGVYSIGLILIVLLNFEYFQHLGCAIGYVLLNAVAHFFTDYVTSRASSSLYEKEEYHDFFVVIGFDQLLHYLTLIVTFVLLVG